MSPSQGKLKQPSSKKKPAPKKASSTASSQYRTDNPLDIFLEEFSRLHERAKREGWYDIKAQKTNSEFKARADIITAIFYALTQAPRTAPASAEQSPQRRKSSSPLRKSQSLSITTSFSTRPSIWCDSPHRQARPKQQPDKPDATFKSGMKNKKSIATLNFVKNQTAGEGAENFKQICYFLANIKLKQNFGRMLLVKATYSGESSTEDLPSPSDLRLCFAEVLKNHKSNYLVPAGSAFVGVYFPFFGRGDLRQGESFEKSIINLLRKAHAAQESLSACDDSTSIRSAPISMRSLGDVCSAVDAHSQMGVSRAHSINGAPGRRPW
jgi:hypothetical protein